MSKSTGSMSHGKASKLPKPHDDYPLFAHQNGQWAKKI